jgi:penicillin-binding protein 2
MYFQNSKAENPNFFVFIKVLLFVVFVFIVGRLAELQIVKGNYYKNLSDNNRIRRVVIRAPRGEILARGGEKIAENKEQEFEITFTERGVTKNPLISEDNGERDRIKEYVRLYPEGSTFAHITGYIGEVNESELGKVEGSCPDKGIMILGNWTGRTGLESQYDCLLRGEDGEELVEVDAKGKKIRVIGRKLPKKGSDLKSHVDVNLQRKVSELMKEKTGAVVVTDRKGEVLAFYSSPSYDANIISSGNDVEKVKKILESPDKPLFNRVIGGSFHPGSVFKPIVAIGALEDKVIDEAHLYEDSGFIKIESPYGDSIFRNWYFTQYGSVEGNINVIKAIARSTDTFFYDLGERMGIEKINDWIEKFKIHEKTGIDLPGEVAGLIPDPVWKMRVKGERWFLGDTYNISIGQGDLAISPAVLERGILAIANNGRLCELKLVGEAECDEIGIRLDTINVVKKGMFAACESGGTGYTFFDFTQKHEGKIKVGCKTGTAETSDSSEDTHAWFTAFSESEDAVERDNSDIVAAVLVEKGGEGSRVAGPIMREIFDYWFGLEKNSQ